MLSLLLVMSFLTVQPVSFYTYNEAPSRRGGGVMLLLLFFSVRLPVKLVKKMLLLVSIKFCETLFLFGGGGRGVGGIYSRYST